MNSLDQLRWLVAVAEHGSFSAAARAKSMSQPGISKQVKALERQYGVLLFERKGRQVRLTQPGLSLYEGARQLLTAAEQLEVRMQEHRDGRIGHLSVAASMSFGAYILPTILASFRAEVPGADIALHILDTEALYAGVEGGEFDFGISAGPHRPSGVVVEDICENQLLLVVAPGHPVLLRTPILPQDLSEHTFLLGLKGSPSWLSRKMLLETNGIYPRRLIEIGHPEATKRTVAAGQEIGLLPLPCVENELRDGRLVALAVQNVRFESRFQLFYRPDRYMTKLMSSFRSYLKQALARSPGSASD